MPRNSDKPKGEEKEDRVVRDKPATSLLKAWGKRMSQGTASIIPVYVGGSWTLQVPRGNKRVLTVPVDDISKKN